MNLGYAELACTLRRSRKKGNFLHTLSIKRRKVNWIGYTLRRNCLLKHAIEWKKEGSVDVTGRRGRRRKQLLDDLNPLAPELFFFNFSTPVYKM